MNTVVWLMIVINAHGGTAIIGPEFTTEAKCKQNAVVVQKAIEDARWGTTLKTPLCVRIEK